MEDDRSARAQAGSARARTRGGKTPLDHAEAHNYGPARAEIVALLRGAC